MNVGDYGVEFLFGVGGDISAATNLSLTFTRADQTVLTVSSPNVSISPNPITTPAGTFLANQYAIYTFQPGDVTVAGSWSVRLTYDAPGPIQLISDVTNFVVGP